MSAGPENVIRVVVGGLPALNDYAPMPAAGAELSDQNVADIVNYVRTHFGNSYTNAVSAADVSAARRRTTSP